MYLFSRGEKKLAQKGIDRGLTNDSNEKVMPNNAKKIGHQARRSCISAEYHGRLGHEGKGGCCGERRGSGVVEGTSGSVRENPRSCLQRLVRLCPSGPLLTMCSESSSLAMS